MNTTLADRMGFQWAGIEGAMKFANRNPAFRHHVESLVDTYFDLIDEMAAELERRRIVNGILNLTRVCRDRQFQSDPPGVVAVLPAGRTAVRPFHPPLRLSSPPAAWP